MTDQDWWNFWRNVKRAGAKIPFVTDVVALYFFAIDPDTPLVQKGIAIVTLGYVFNPADAIPDPTPVVGYSDDAAVILSAMAVLGAAIKPKHRRQAKVWLNNEDPESPFGDEEPDGQAPA